MHPNDPVAGAAYQLLGLGIAFHYVSRIDVGYKESAAHALEKMAIDIVLGRLFCFLEDVVHVVATP
jgi:hypothetical protein